ncbi:DNA-3-methyladenine glycosylase family protein [Vibrio sp. NH-7]
MEKITAHLRQQYPDLIVFLDQASPINELDAKNTHIVEAMARIIVGQMLSRHVANAIFRRVEHLFQSPEQLLECNESDFTQHGVSKNKAKAILNFAEMYFHDPERFEQWSSLDFEQLRREAKDIWGVSDWSLSILAIFHFGHSDVFPEKDGTLKRALFKFQEQKINIDVDDAKPYRSYLALYLWKFIDEDII